MGLGAKIKDFFIGGTADAATDTAGKIADIVEKWHPGEVKKAEIEMDVQRLLEESYSSARLNDQPQNTGFPLVDSLVNGVNRLIRPWVTIEVLGSWFGYWDLPPPDSIDPHYWTAGMTILGFWFGGRFVVKDIPQAVAWVAKKVKK